MNMPLTDYERHNQCLRERYTSLDRPVTRRITTALAAKISDLDGAIAILAGFLGDAFWHDPSMTVNTRSLARFLTKYGLSPEDQSHADAAALLKERGEPYLPF